jgi:hypothetical protein
VSSEREYHVWIVEQYRMDGWSHEFGHVYATKAQAKIAMAKHRELYTRGTYRIRKYVRQP